MPLGWTFFKRNSLRAGVTKEASKTGKQSLKMTCAKAPNDFEGANLKLPVAPGRKYTFSAFFKNDKLDPLGGTAHSMLVLEWHAADGTEMNRIQSRMFDANLSRLRWEQQLLKSVAAPPGAVTAIFGIHLCDGDSGGRGSILVDDVTIVEE